MSVPSRAKSSSVRAGDSITRTPETFVRWWPGLGASSPQRAPGRARRRPRRPRPAQFARCRAHGVEDAAILEQSCSLDERLAVEVLIGHDPRRSGLGQRACAFLGLVGRRVRIRDHDHRHPSALASASVDDPALPTSRSAARSASVISARRKAYGLYRARRSAGNVSRRLSILRITRLARHVEDVRLLDERRQRVGDRAVQPPDRLRAAENEQHRQILGQVQLLARRRLLASGERSDRRARREALARQRGARLGKADGQRARYPRRCTNAATGYEVALPISDAMRNPAPARRTGIAT